MEWDVYVKTHNCDGWVDFHMQLYCCFIVPLFLVLVRELVYDFRNLIVFFTRERLYRQPLKKYTTWKIQLYKFNRHDNLILWFIFMLFLLRN